MTSAKLNQGLDDLFLDLTKSMLTIHPSSGTGSGGGKSGNVTLGEDPEPRGRRGGVNVLEDFERQQDKSSGGGGICCS